MTSSSALDDLGLPSFGRVEIALATRKDIGKAAGQLAALARALAQIEASENDDDTARLVAYRKIRAISIALRPKT